MKEFIIYFELYGKKMKTTVRAYNETGAKKVVQEKIVFHKIVKKAKNDLSDEDVKNFLGDDNTFNELMNMFGKDNDSKK